jgi:hypothetical protein
MVQIGSVRMAMADRLVGVPVRVLAVQGLFVGVAVMQIIVPMNVLVPNGLMRMVMLMPLSDVQYHTEEHQDATQDGPEFECPVTDCERQSRTQKGTCCKDRCRARRPKLTLGEKVQIETQTVPKRADQYESGCLRNRRIHLTRDAGNE